MDNKKIWELEYAVHCLNGLHFKDDNLILLWNTSLGIAKFRSINYIQNSKFAVLSESVVDGMIPEITSHINSEKNDIFSETEKVFTGELSGSKINVMKDNNRLDILLQALFTAISKLDDENLKCPEYNCLYEFQTINKNLKLPFVLNGMDLVKEPIALVLES